MIDPLSVLPISARTHVRRADLCGSRITCTPAPTDTDQDIIVLATSPIAEFYIEDALIHDGWDQCGRDEYGYEEGFGTMFIAYRKGENNVILTTSYSFYGRFMEATRECTRLNLLRKEDRVALFQGYLYGAAKQTDRTAPNGWETLENVR